MPTVSPSLTAGSGLKQRRIEKYNHRVWGISQLNRWERIETVICTDSTISAYVSPSLTAGSGLKPRIERTDGRNIMYLPA